MFIDEDSLFERLKISRSNVDSLRRRSERIETDESETVDSSPIDPDLLQIGTGLELIPLPKRGRPEGYTNKTEAEKILIGLEARILGQTSAARNNNVSQPYAGLCEKGKTNTDAASPIDERLVKKVDSEIDKIRSQALEGLKSSVSVLNGKLSESMKTNDAIGVASALVKIVNISTPDEKKDQASRLIIMAPQLRDEKHYEVIDVG